jgi:hypothetical protein
MNGMGRGMWLAVALACGCSHSGEPLPGPATGDDAQLSQLSSQLNGLTTEAAAANDSNACPRVCQLSQDICDVSDRICQVTARHPDRPDMAARCSDARLTCERGRQDCAQRCPNG